MDRFIYAYKSAPANNDSHCMLTPNLDEGLDGGGAEFGIQ